MEVVSVVPSKNRPGMLSAKTLAWLCLSSHPYFVFVEPQDYDAYLEVVAPENLVEIDKNDMGLGYVKHFIEEWLKDKPYQLVMKMDDDVRGWQVRGNKTTPVISAKVFDKAIRDSVAAFEKYKDLGAVCFPYRWELWTVKQWTALNARLQTCYLIRKELFIGHPEVSTFEDFFNYMHIRSQNKMTLRYGLIGIDADVGKAAGGLQSFDRHKMALREAEIIRERYPAIEFKKVEGKRWGIEPVMKGAFFNVKGL